MKFSFFVIAIFFYFSSVNAQHYKKIHFKAILIDTHNDLLTQCFEKHVSFDQNLTGITQSDINRFKKGGVDAQFFSVWCDGKKEHPYEYALSQIDTLYATISRNPDKIVLVKNSSELLQAVKEKKIAALIGVEGGHMIENDLNKLDTLFAKGVRYLTLTWNNSTSWATSAAEETNDSLLHQPKGLNDFGKQIIHHMNELGMLVDISHVGEKTFWNVIATTTKPVLVSHSSVYNICPVPRNLKDDQIKAVAKNGGVIDVNFFSAFVDSNFKKREKVFFDLHKTEADSILKTGTDEDEMKRILFKKYPGEAYAIRPTLSLLMDHIDYLVKLAGIDHVGIGSDFDGVYSTPQQLDDVTTYPLITKELLKRGYSKEDINKILGGNVLRVLKANEVRITQN